MELTEFDFKEHLKEQIEFLQLSSISYDNGFDSEAKRLAVVCRVLLHDTPQSKSLLNLLNRKSIDFYDSSYPYNAKNLIPHMGLLKLENKSGEGAYSRYMPLLDNLTNIQRNRKRSFKSWWEKAIILEDSNKSPFSRKDIVIGLTNKDGGAHVDPKLSQKYSNLTRQNSVGWRFRDGDSESPVLGSELASMRQIAHEVLKTLHDEFPECF
ncbi:hypothetical protein [Psychrobacillus sp. FSL K6-1415]|uniref:hypothetical protein n=1 Tax=Psychrobacillus sp. FSL K6-1415 TaxID=2921544 RepID=UPI0030F727D3